MLSRNVKLGRIGNNISLLSIALTSSNSVGAYCMKLVQDTGKLLRVTRHAFRLSFYPLSRVLVQEISVSCHDRASKDMR